MGNHPSVRSEVEMDCALTNYMEDTVRNHLQFKESEEEVNAIKLAVWNMVDGIMGEVKNVDSRFEMLRKIIVGSMAEGTRIVKPDEFDFMVVMKHLSTPGVVDIKRDQTHNLDCGFAHVTLRDEESWLTWSDICENGELRSTKKDGIFQQIKYKLFRKEDKIGFREVFWNKVTIAVENLFETEFTINTRYGILSFENISVELHGPAVTPSLVWYSFQKEKNMIIPVDLVAVIECDIGELVKVNDALSPSVFQELKYTGRVHLMPAGRVSPCSEGQCFQIACSETEIRLIKNLNQNHKMCYKILKDMFNTRNKRATHLIISYVLKTLILQHAFDCSERRSAGICLMKLVTVIRTSFILPPNIALSPIFFKKKNIFLFSESMLQLDQHILTKGSISEMFENVERVRKVYPLTSDDSDQNQIRIQVQPKDFPTLSIALIALGLPISYMLPTFVLHIIHQLGGWCMSYSYRNILMFLHFLEVVLMLCKLSALFLGSRFFLSKKNFILAAICICIYWIWCNVSTLTIHYTAIKRLLFVEQTSEKDILVFLNLKEIASTSFWETDSVLVYRMLSPTFAYFLYSRHRRSNYKWMWTCVIVIVHLSWLYLAYTGNIIKLSLF